MEIYVSSDWHGGYEHADYTKIYKFIDIAERDADQVILPGDIFDMWRYPLNSMNAIDRDKVLALAQRILDLSTKVPVILIPGNHDHTLDNAWEFNRDKYPNMIITSPYIEKGIYYTHGWEYDVQQYPFSGIYWIFPHIVPYLYQMFARKPSEILQRSDNPGDSVRRIHENAQLDANNKRVKYVVMGHTHIPWSGGNVIDAGDMVDSGSYVIIEDGVPRIMYV